MYKTTSDTTLLYYVHLDHLGSIAAVTDANKNVVSRYAYTPWGGRLLLSGTNITDRGYTLHEHIAAFGLIDMNGRMYDPVLARFLSPDPYVQAPDFTQSFNRYTYCWNNPFSYTDPSGEFLSTITTAIVGFIEAIGRGIIAPFFVGFADTSKAGKMFQNAWEDYGTQMQNAWNIDMGLFKTDPNKTVGGQIWELVSRFTWQLPQTILGNAVMTGGNIAYQVDNVSYGYGVTAVDMGVGGGITIGNYTAGPRGYKADWKDHLFVHEYGHYIQSQQHGPAYLFTVGIPSLQSAIMQKNNNPASPRHHDRWFEADASYKAATYFDQYYGSGIKDYVVGSSDYFDKNSFVYGSTTGSPYKNPRTKGYNYSSHATSSKFHWTDPVIYIPLLGLIPAIFY